VLLPNARSILKMGPSLTTYKLLLMAAAWSRPSVRELSLALLRPFVHKGEITMHYTCEGRRRTVFVRMDDMLSDYYSVLELGVHHVYNLDKDFVPELIVDCGGNIGLFSLSASALYPSSRIVICEPVPRNLGQIQKHMQVNGLSPEILPVCIGGARRRIPFYVREANQGSFDRAKPYSSVLDVEVLTLADVMRNRDARTILIKLDIEGMEIEALESYVPDEDRPVCIVGELHDHKSNGQILAKIFSSKGWTIRFEDETDQGSLFHAYSPAARSMLEQPSGSQVGR
jgi:FkbM family methyltransferase